MLEVKEIHVNIAILRKNETIIWKLQDVAVRAIVFIKKYALT